MTRKERLSVMELKLELGNRGGGGSNLGRRRPRLPLGMVGGRSS